MVDVENDNVKMMLWIKLLLLLLLLPPVVRNVLVVAYYRVIKIDFFFFLCNALHYVCITAVLWSSKFVCVRRCVVQCRFADSPTSSAGAQAQASTLNPNENWRTHANINPENYGARAYGTVFFCIAWDMCMLNVCRYFAAVFPVYLISSSLREEPVFNATPNFLNGRRCATHSKKGFVRGLTARELVRYINTLLSGAYETCT